MGCGASIPRPCTPEELAELCQIGCKEMEILCVREGMKKKDEVVVKPPDAVNKFRGNALKLREAAAHALTQIDELCGADAAQGMVGDQAQNGFLGKAMGAMAQAADAAAAMVGATAGAVVEKSLTLLADGMDKAVAGVEGPFTKVGREILAAKENELLQVYADYINKYQFSDAVLLVRGAEPWGPEEYAACPGDSISKAVTAASVEDLAKQLLPVVQAEIKQHSVTKAWDSLIESSNKAHEKISQYKKLEDFGIERPQLDLNQHIVTETILQLGLLMGKAEMELRQKPEGKSRVPETFEAVFSGTRLHKGHYGNRSK